MTISTTSPLGAATAGLIYAEDHKDRAHLTMLGQFQDKPRMVALVKCMAQAVQIQEDESFNVYLSRVMELAQGDMLDKYGEILGERRDGMPDYQYMRIIQGRGLANTTHSVPDELIELYQLLTAPSVVVYESMFPDAPVDDGCGCFTLYAHRDGPMDEVYRGKVRRIMRDAKPGSFEMECIESYTGNFGFAEDPTAEPWNVGAWAREI